jgi:methionine synthase I (cobalamin-dependent)
MCYRHLIQEERYQISALLEAGFSQGAILTNTFRANAIAMHGCPEDDLDAINRAGVALSR